jgi:6-pyruvoyltetrahydropterin/6-carboxytetrahydropterin synthase
MAHSDSAQGRLFTLELSKEDMKFSAGHFTIFSATERERLHGHNFAVQVHIDARMQGNGMGFDYGVYKKRIRQLCEAWDEYFILPGNSPYLRFEEEGAYLYACFDQERIPFLKSDVLVLPIENATVEAFSFLLLEKLTADAEELAHFQIEGVQVKVFSGPGQCGGARWKRPA